MKNKDEFETTKKILEEKIRKKEEKIHKEKLDLDKLRDRHEVLLAMGEPEDKFAFDNGMVKVNDV